MNLNLHLKKITKILHYKICKGPSDKTRLKIGINLRNFHTFFFIHRLYVTAKSQNQVERVIKSFKNVKNLMSRSEDDLWYENEDEVDLPEPEWNPYGDCICNESHDIFEKLLETDNGDGDKFDGL